MLSTCASYPLAPPSTSAGMLHAMIRPLPAHAVTRSLLVIGVAFAYGWLTGRIEAPEDPAVFWIGNLAAPYLVIGLLAGAWTGRKAGSAAIVGALSVMATVAGFYNLPRIVAAAQQVPSDTSRASAIFDALGRWLSLMLWSSAPWLTIGLIIGAVMGLLGHRWAKRRSLIGWYVTGAALAVEPFVYASDLSARLAISWPYGMTPHNMSIWGTEFVIGLGVLAATYHAHRGRVRRTALPSSP